MKSEPSLNAWWYILLIVMSCASMTGRIMTVRSALGETPLLSANDRSRWSTVRALVDEGTYQIDDVIFRDDGKRDREWYTIDMVRHRGWDGHEHYYSSKPPLLATLLAGPYWVVRHGMGVKIAEKPFYVVRILLVLVNVLPMAIYFGLLALMIEQWGRSVWGKCAVFGAATFGTYLTTFAVTLNNHLPAAISVLIASYAAVQIFRDPESRSGRFAAAGFFAAFAVTNELPALSFFALLGGILLLRDWRRTLLAYLPAAAFVAVAFFGTNYWAHASWRPPYTHRDDGAAMVHLESYPKIRLGTLSSEWHRQLANGGLTLSERAEFEESPWDRRWRLFDPTDSQRYAVVQLETGGVEIRAWDNWYEYENSYWLPGRKSGVDLGEPSQAVYAFHVLIGHRGLFSLTPIWILSAIGIGIWLARGTSLERGFAASVLLLTLVCLTFYLLRPIEDRNYGGVAAGFRWMFWFIPLWLICALPAADWAAQHRWSRVSVAVLLAVSVFSAAYAGLNPWAHSWIYQYWTELGWL